jgi:hypothetical protein
VTNISKTPYGELQQYNTTWYPGVDVVQQRFTEINEKLGRELFDEYRLPAPRDFVAESPNGVLLPIGQLAPKGKQPSLERTFDGLWKLYEPPAGYTKWRWDRLKADAKHLRQAPGYDWNPGVRWVEFDPTAYHGLSPENALKQSTTDNVQLGGIEVLWALLLLPEWVTSWNGTDSPYPNLSGLQFYWESGWSNVPCLRRWGGSRQVGLDAIWAAYAGGYWSSPVVREC